MNKTCPFCKRSIDADDDKEGETAEKQQQPDAEHLDVVVDGV